MTIKVKFFAFFREIFDAREKAMTFPAGATIRGMLEALADSPRRRDELFAGTALKPLVIVMKNGTADRLAPGIGYAARGGRRHRRLSLRDGEGSRRLQPAAGPFVC